MTAILNINTFLPLFKIANYFINLNTPILKHYNEGNSMTSNCNKCSNKCKCSDFIEFRELIDTLSNCLYTDISAEKENTQEAVQKVYDKLNAISEETIICWNLTEDPPILVTQTLQRSITINGYVIE